MRTAQYQDRVLAPWNTRVDLQEIRLVNESANA